MFAGSCMLNHHIAPFTQLWFGYSITGEVKLQLAVIFKGRGSNGKTVIGRVLERVLGSEIRKSLPCASLGKPDGVNNDPLFNARKARVVTVSEIDRGSDIKEKRFKEITGRRPRCLPRPCMARRFPSSQS